MLGGFRKPPNLYWKCAVGADGNGDFFVLSTKVKNEIQGVYVLMY